jgi:aspartate/methionine/tyrosine aminotransferase
MRILSDAAKRLEGQPMFQILEKAKALERAGHEVIHFELGDPDFKTPENIVQACLDSIKKGETHYVGALGILELRNAAREAMKKGARKFYPDLDQVMVTPGANLQIFYVLACVANPGDEIIIPDPSFPTYNSIIKFLGLKAIKVRLKEENSFRLDPKEVEKVITPRTRLIIINSPSNPTGSIMKEEEVREVYNLCKKHDLYLLSDEIYSRMYYDVEGIRPFSATILDECKERTILVNGFSKSYSMTGWRLGVLIAPKLLVEKMSILLEATSSCVAPFIQKAGVEALNGSQEEVKNMMAEYKSRRDLIVKELNNLPGVSCIMPPGAFYVFPNIKKTGMSSKEFCDFMLDNAKVAISPGTIFGQNGEGYVRLSYVTSKENIIKGIARMKYCLENKNDFTKK